jgi:hypothetical protein
MLRSRIAHALERSARWLQDAPAAPGAAPAEGCGVRMQGLPWGGYGLRLDYDYTPEVRPLEFSRGGRAIAARILRDRARIERMIGEIAAVKDHLGRIGAEPDPTDPQQPHWNNSWLPALDAVVLSALVAAGKPRTYLEVGSGNSTKLVRRAIRDHGLGTRIVSLDPQPRAEVDAICDEVVRKPIEAVDIEALADRLQQGDVVFVDKSHRGFQNSDVTISFLEQMPALAARRDLRRARHLPALRLRQLLPGVFLQRAVLPRHVPARRGGRGPGGAAELPRLLRGRAGVAGRHRARSSRHLGGDSGRIFLLARARPARPGREGPNRAVPAATLHMTEQSAMPLLTDHALERLIEPAPDIVLSAHGQITVYDRLTYYWAAREFFTGQGTIVDAGALVGGTTVIFGEGLNANPRAQAARPTIHVYDLFEDDRDGYSAQLLRGWYNEQNDRSNPYDFLRHFKRHTQSYERYLSVHKGDITKHPYDDARGIEVLSIDVAKNADLMLHCARDFFPRLIPGQSVILHQDYVFPYQPWLHVAMELMSDIVEKVYDPPSHCTAVFVPKRAITAAEVEARLGRKGADYYHLGNVRYLYQAIEKARPGFGQLVHTAALAYFYATMGQRKTAIYVANRMLEQHDPTLSLLETAALVPFLKNDLGIEVGPRGR